MGAPCAVCLSVVEEVRGARVFVCHPVDSLRGGSDNEGEVCIQAHGCMHMGTRRVCGRWTRLWVAEGGCKCLAVCGFVDVGAFECLQALLGMSACMFTCVCVCVTSHLRPVQKQEDAFWWHVEAPGGRPPVATTTHLLSLSFFFIHF